MYTKGKAFNIIDFLNIAVGNICHENKKIYDGTQGVEILATGITISFPNGILTHEIVIGKVKP
jgi:hypothetical protein